MVEDFDIDIAYVSAKIVVYEYVLIMCQPQRDLSLVNSNVEQLNSINIYSSSMIMRWWSGGLHCAVVVRGIVNI